MKMDLVAFVAFENGFEGLEGFGGEGAVEETVDGVADELKAHANDEESDCEGDEGIQPGPAGDPDEEHAEEDARGGPDIGHEMMAIGLEGGAVGGAAFRDEEAADDEVEDGSQSGNGQAGAELLDLGGVGDAIESGPEDGAGGTEDEGAFEATGEEFDFVVAEGVFVVGWQGGNEQGTESGGSGSEIDEGFERVGEETDGSGEFPSEEFEGDGDHSGAQRKPSIAQEVTAGGGHGGWVDEE